MPVLCGLAKFPELTPFIQCEYHCAHGIGPGVVSIVVPVPSNGEAPLAIDTVDDLTLTDGTATFVLHDVRAFDANRVAVGGGFGWQVTLHDRRWRWQWGSISGRYNERDQGGKIIQSSRVS